MNEKIPFEQNPQGQNLSLYETLSSGQNPLSLVELVLGLVFGQINACANCNFLDGWGTEEPETLSLGQ